MNYQSPVPPEPQTGAHQWRFYLSPREAWEAMYGDCLDARRSIEFEQYIVENDSVGRKFMRLFIHKAKQGVKVFLILDRFGSQTIAHSRLIRQLRRAGGKIRFYNSVTWFDILRPWRWYPRTHVKTLLVDSTVAYTGGVCLAERMRDWRDTQIRITGPVVEQIHRVFERAERHRRHSRRLASGEGGEFDYLQNLPVRSWFIIYKALVRAIHSAEKNIYLTTPFFAPNRRFRRLLAHAAKRGVDVRILVPQCSEYSVVDWICLSYAGKLLRAGVRMFFYRPCILHQKTMVVDGRWGTVGSANMDILSFFRNRESNIVTTNREAVAELTQHFMMDLKQCDELTLDQLGAQRWKRAVGYCLRLLRSFV